MFARAFVILAVALFASGCLGDIAGIVRAIGTGAYEIDGWGSDDIVLRPSNVTILIHVNDRTDQGRVMILWNETGWTRFELAKFSGRADDPDAAVQRSTLAGGPGSDDWPWATAATALVLGEGSGRWVDETQGMRLSAWTHARFVVFDGGNALRFPEGARVTLDGKTVDRLEIVGLMVIDPATTGETARSYAFATVGNLPDDCRFPLDVDCEVAPASSTSAAMAGDTQRG